MSEEKRKIVIELTPEVYAYLKRLIDERISELLVLKEALEGKIKNEEKIGGD